MNRSPVGDEQQISVPVLSGELEVDRLERSKDTVRVTVQTRTDEQLVDANVTNTRVEIERIPINRIVETAPPMRTEEDVTIIPVMEETVVVERRLILKEEIVLRRVREVQRHQEKVALRKQEAVVERAPSEQTDSSKLER